MKALVTGATSGIGLDIARYLATKKIELILVARNKTKLEEIQEQLPTKVTIILADLSEDMAAEQKARSIYENLIDLATDKDVIGPLLFLRQREVIHFERFKELYHEYKRKIKQM